MIRPIMCRATKDERSSLTLTQAEGSRSSRIKEIWPHKERRHAWMAHIAPETHSIEQGSTGNKHSISLILRRVSQKRCWVPLTLAALPNLPRDHLTLPRMWDVTDNGFMSSAKLSFRHFPSTVVTKTVTIFGHIPRSLVQLHKSPST